MNAQAQAKPIFILSAVNYFGVTVYYTGRAGEGWVSDDFGQAFDFGGQGGAQYSCDLFNRRSTFTGLIFKVEEV